MVKDLGQNVAKHLFKMLIILCLTKRREREREMHLKYDAIFSQCMAQSNLSKTMPLIKKLP